MVKIFLSINNNEEVILLPITPPEIEKEREWESSEVEGLRQSVNIIKNKRLDTLKIETFFPGVEYPFSLSNEMSPQEYVDTIERWQERRVPLRLIITEDGETIENMAVSIVAFKTRKGKTKDLDYVLELKEFPFVEVK